MSTFLSNFTGNNSDFAVAASCWQTVVMHGRDFITCEPNPFFIKFAKFVHSPRVADSIKVRNCVSLSENLSQGGFAVHKLDSVYARFVKLPTFDLRQQCVQLHVVQMCYSSLEDNPTPEFRECLLPFEQYREQRHE